MRFCLSSLCALTSACSLACGGSSSPPPTQPDTAPKASPSPEAVAPSASPAPTPSAAPSAEAAYDDPDEAKDPQTLTPLIDKAHLPPFPKATDSEKDCWRSVHLAGDAHKDFDSLVASCGAPTGAAEYVKPATGKLHSVKDKRDTFNVKVAGGLCYRFFGVSDGTIKNLDILILRGQADLVGQDKVDGPVAIIDSDKAWCFDSSSDFQFRVEINGSGEGHYVFGAWARPLGSAGGPKGSAANAKKGK
jgi:hypothetical protein